MKFPLFVDLTGKKAVVVGGGKIACRRIDVLRQFGAEITVIAPEYSGETEGLIWKPRPYAPGDLKGAFLAIAATDDRSVNHLVGREAALGQIPVSVADRQEECSFFFPAVCFGEGLVAGLVSDGQHHCKTAAAAAALRSTLEGLK
ncbi:MAG: NAD(P)-dependent oxidoreductase [Pseudoflavonifractor sp.]